MKDDIPDGLHALEYGRWILENVLGWPTKGNHEMMADCLTSISKSRGLTLVQATKYMLRSIRLAQSQHIKIDTFWFRDGGYTQVRPEPKESFKGTWKPIDKAATIAEQSKPEWEEESRKVREKLAMLAGKKKMP